MILKNLLAVGLLSLGMATAWAAPVNYTAGSAHKGSVQGDSIDWTCGDGKCTAIGSSADSEADMKACQGLAKQVGPLGYFKSTAGTDWSPSKNSNRMAYCNAAVAFK
ncbi:hypothetical protein ACF3NA_01385 [Alkanindiges sp. WGS2144]|uniref:hypothetical protein n=1 Tax=Alkanindiges sp. WGS2144 TaxID=3366808 RepID=UPI003751188B